MGALPQPPIMVITDRGQAPAPLVETLRPVLAAGIAWVGVREKDLSEGEQIALAREIRALDQKVFVSFFGPPELAWDAGAQGIHLDRTGDVAAARAMLGPDILIGKSCHDADEIAGAEGADYITLSPVFETASKPGHRALGPDRFAALAARSSVPVLALGGVTAEQCGALRKAGAAGVAVMGEVMRAADPGAVAETFVAAFREPG